MSPGVNGDRQPTALVTGASRGIGQAIARELALRGYRLHLVGRNRETLEATAAFCRGRGSAPAEGEASFPAGDAPAPTEPSLHVTDLAQMDQVRALAETILAATIPRSPAEAHPGGAPCTEGPDSAGPALDLLVLNAGAAVSAALEETTLEQWDRIFDINVRSPFVLVQGLLPALRNARGRVFVVGSVVSTEAYAGQGAYVASKHALYGFTRVLAKELHSQEITVQTVLPGGVATDMVREMRPDIDTDDLIQPDDVAAALGMVLDMNGNAVTDEIRLRRRGKTPWA